MFDTNVIDMAPIERITDTGDFSGPSWWQRMYDGKRASKSRSSPFLKRNQLIKSVLKEWHCGLASADADSTESQKD